MMFSDGDQQFEVEYPQQYFGKVIFRLSTVQ